VVRKSGGPEVRKSEGPLNIEETLKENIRKYLEGWSLQSKTENKSNNHSPHLEGSSRRSSTENEPNNSSRHLEDPWKNPPNVEVRKFEGSPNVEETLKKREERIRKYLESQQPQKKQSEREYQDDDQDSWGGGDDF